MLNKLQIMSINNHTSNALPSTIKVSALGLVLLLLVLLSPTTLAQEQNRLVRFAKITVDPAQLAEYTTALQEQMNTAIRVEPGVLSYHAVADKSDPTSITILEVYADTAAYQSHILTPHFLKYKDTVKDMVKSLELVDLSVIGFVKKPD
jgi:quinol monooxygenase YgiN